MSDNKSSGDRLRQAATGQQVARREDTNFPAILTKYKVQLAAALPKHINADRMLRVALTAFRQQPKLAECDPKSVFAAVIIGAQLGLEPGILGQAYLVPYGKECQFIPGWQGMQDLVNRSGRASTWTGAVFEGDVFEYEYGSNPHISHKPCGEDRVEKLTHVYAVGRIKGAEFPVIEVWPVLKVTRHRDKYNKVGPKHYSFKHFEMYGRKVALLQVLKYMPKSIEMAAAIGLSHAADEGQIIDIKEAIENTYLPLSTAETIDNASTTDTSDSLESAALEALKSADTIEELNTRWADVKAAYDSAGQPVAATLEPAFNERRDAIKAAAAKKYAEAKGG